MAKKKKGKMLKVEMLDDRRIANMSSVERADYLSQLFDVLILKGIPMLMIEVMFKTISTMTMDMMGIHRFSNKKNGK